MADKMKLYNCIVRIGAQQTHEVPKYSVTAAEIMMLRATHGDDAVKDITAAGDAMMSQRRLRDQLEASYPPVKEGETVISRVGAVFGVVGKLPTELEDPSDEIEEAIEDEEAA